MRIDTSRKKERNSQKYGYQQISQTTIIGLAQIDMLYQIKFRSHNQRVEVDDTRNRRDNI